MPKLRLSAFAALVAISTGFGLHAGAQTLQVAPEPGACVAKRAARADPLLEAKIAAAEQRIDQRQPGTWAALNDLGQYACAVTGDRQPVDKAFRRCISDCADDRDVYFAHVFYANVLEQFGDLLGAENQYLQALLSRDEPQTAYTAYMSYATMLERQRRTRDALDVLNRFAGEWSYRSPPMQLKLSLMRSLGMDTRAEEAAAQARSDADLMRTRTDAPPMSAVPVERNPLAQLAFSRTVEVQGSAWIEPAAEGGAPGPGRLYYRRASVPDPSTFARVVTFQPGQRFVVVADVGAVGCRVAVDDARYDVEDCPWRSGRADASLFRVVDERTPLEPPLRIRVQSPLSGELVEVPAAGRPAASE